MTRKRDIEQLQYLDESLARQFGVHALVHFPDEDLILVAESPKVMHHAVYLATIEGIELMYVLVEPGTYTPFPERGIIASQRCSDELACLISIADLYYGIWREYDPSPSPPSKETGQME